MKSLFSIVPVALLGCLALYTPQHEAAAPADPGSILVMGNATIPVAATVPSIEFDRSEDGEAQPKAKMDRRKKRPDCPCSCDCGCCETGICTCCQKNYAEGIREAKRTGKPLVVWVGCACPSMEKDLGEFVHCHSKELDGKPVPYVAVLKFDGNAYTGGTGWSLIPNCEMIRRAAAPAQQVPAAPAEHCPPIPQQQAILSPQVYVAPRMVFQPAPMMPMMGGWGGGGSGGGGGC